ncbi:MAG TPA: 50S ribosomal protein L17 [Proteobacteria bacterium]|nr:50S ribosomal protein L17 [bacterium BMS3Abin14]HDL53042.1 50S ribosomal protein L17 [Pseudomonadota bacterium]
MRHQKSGKKLGRTSAHRKALLRNMVTSLLKHERIVTTAVKAREVGRVAERMITLGKRGTLHARRQTIAFIESGEVVKRIFSVYAERYRNRDGGYTRVIKLEPRSGDNAPMAIVELVDRPVEAKDSDKKQAKADAKQVKTDAKQAKAETRKTKTETMKAKPGTGKAKPKKAAAPKKSASTTAKKKVEVPKEEKE